jgi:isopenicillin N synthase-like dioxygenase
MSGGIAVSEPDVGAVNQDFVRYDQVEKGHTYRLAESAKDEFDTDYRIQTFDFGRYLEGNAADRAAFAGEFGAAVQEIGFSVLVNHGVDTRLYDEIEENTETLFTTTSLDDKMRFRARRHGSVSQGYFPIRETSGIHPDLVEGWVWCRRAFDMPQERTAPYRPEAFWPDAGYEPVFRRLALAHERLFKPIARAMFQGLGIDPNVYDDKLTETNFGLRLNYYPPLSAADDASGAGRLLGHEDVDLFTILPAAKVGGLQVWNHMSRKWVRLDAPPGSLIINTGDYMQRITNDRLPSTSHRVGRPADGSHRDRARISFPIAVYVREEEILDVLPGLGAPKYEPIRAITFHTRSTSKFYGDDYAVESPLNGA